MQALIDACDTPKLPHTSIVLVFSNRKAAYGLTRAANAIPPIPTGYLALQPFLKAHEGSTRDDYDAEVAKRVLSAKPHAVVLAGWMHVLGDSFLAPLTEAHVPVINLHPALPGAFDGANAIGRAFEAIQGGEIDRAGCMVHRVIREVDRGEPIVVREIAVDKDISMEEFEERIHKAEWEIIVEATKKILDEVCGTTENV